MIREKSSSRGSCPILYTTRTHSNRFAPAAHRRSVISSVSSLYRGKGAQMRRTQIIFLVPFMCFYLEALCVSPISDEPCSDFWWTLKIMISSWDSCLRGLSDHTFLCQPEHGRTKAGLRLEIVEQKEQVSSPRSRCDYLFVLCTVTAWNAFPLISHLNYAHNKISEIRHTLSRLCSRHDVSIW